MWTCLYTACGGKTRTGCTARPEPVKWLVALLAVLVSAAPAAGEPAPLQLEATVKLLHTGGRIDHMAVDLRRRKLFVAELGNGTVDVIDLAAHVVVGRIGGLNDPQGVGYSAAADRLAVASAGDGTVRYYRGDTLAPAGVTALGDDADNIRVDPRDGSFVVGYGRGGLAVLDPVSGARRMDVRLPAHPEGFQLDPDRPRAYVNLPDPRQVVAVDLVTGRIAWTLPTGAARGNFPMAIASSDTALAVVFRSPAELMLIDRERGVIRARLPACDDADDVFFDPKRRQIYVSCGGGVVDTWRWDGAAYRAMPPTPTAGGARTSLFVPELDRLFVAERAGLLGSEGAVRIYAPVGDGGR